MGGSYGRDRLGLALDPRFDGSVQLHSDECGNSQPTYTVAGEVRAGYGFAHHGQHLAWLPFLWRDFVGWSADYST